MNPHIHRGKSEIKEMIFEVVSDIGEYNIVTRKEIIEKVNDKMQTPYRVLPKQIGSVLHHIIHHYHIFRKMKGREDNYYLFVKKTQRTGFIDGEFRTNFTTARRKLQRIKAFNY